jgi:hypothetical protein
VLFAKFKNADSTSTEISISQDANGKYKERNVSTYDAADNLIKREQFDENNEAVNHNYIRISYLYDEQGNKKQGVEYLYNGNPLDANLYKVVYY